MVNRSQYKANTEEPAGSRWAAILLVAPLVLLGWLVLHIFVAPVDQPADRLTEEEKALTQNSVSETHVEATEGLPEQIKRAIDDDLKFAYHKLKLRSQKVEHENHKTRQQQVFGDGGSYHGQVYDLSTRQHDPALQVLNDVRRQPEEVGSLEDEIYAEVALDQWIAEDDNARVHELVQEYKRRARADGYEVEFNKDLLLTVLREVRMKDKPIRVPQSTRSDSGFLLDGGQVGSR